MTQNELEAEVARLTVELDVANKKIVDLNERLALTHAAFIEARKQLRSAGVIHAA